MDQASLLLRKQLKGARLGSLRLPWATCKVENSMARSNVLRVRAELTKRPVEGFSAGLVDDVNLFEWQVTIMGPPDTY